MSVLEGLLAGIVAEPLEETRWLVLADWLDEFDGPRRAELLRLHRKILATCCDGWSVTGGGRNPDRSLHAPLSTLRPPRSTLPVSSGPGRVASPAGDPPATPTIARVWALHRNRLEPIDRDRVVVGWGEAWPEGLFQHSPQGVR